MTPRALIAIGLLAAQAVAAQPMHQFAYLGQSNAVGLAVLPTSPDPTSPSIAMWRGGPWIFSFVEPSGGQFMQISGYPQSGSSGSYSAGQSFAMQMLAEHPSWSIGVVNVAVGATSLCQWMPGVTTATWTDGAPCPGPSGVHTNPSTLYGAGLNVVNAALAVTPGATRDAILWDQGENDMAAPLDASRYLANLIVLVRQMRGDDYGSSQTPFIIGETTVVQGDLPFRPYPYKAQVQAAQYAAASIIIGAPSGARRPGGQIPHSCMAYTEDLQEACPDPAGACGTTLCGPTSAGGCTMNSQGILGQRMAQCYEALERQHL